MQADDASMLGHAATPGCVSNCHLLLRWPQSQVRLLHRHTVTSCRVRGQQCAGVATAPATARETFLFW